MQHLMLLILILVRRNKQYSYQQSKGDGLDFSGSNLSINNVQINNSLDKAISVGEGTNVEMYNLLISIAEQG